MCVQKHSPKIVALHAEVWSLAAYHTALSNYGGNLEYGLGASFALVLVVIGIGASLIYFRLFNFKRLITKPLIEG